MLFRPRGSEIRMQPQNHINNPLRIGRSSEVVRSVVIVVGALTLIECLIVAAAKETPGTQDVSIAGTFPNPHWEVARQLTLLGVQAGDRVAAVGHHLLYFWARSARVRIVSEVLLNDPACGGQAVRRKVRRAG